LQPDRLPGGNLMMRRPIKVGDPAFRFPLVTLNFVPRRRANVIIVGGWEARIKSSLTEE
jgi:hypothetical protein